MQSNARRGSAEAKAWAAETARRVGAEVRRLRSDVHGLSAVQLAERTAELGYPITRGTLAKIESNSRAGKLDVSELVVLAKALRVPPLQLLFSALPDGPVDVLPNVTVRSRDAVTWFSGEEMDHAASVFAVALGVGDDPPAQGENWRMSEPIRRTRKLIGAINACKTAFLEASDERATPVERDNWQRTLHERTRELRDLVGELRRAGMPVTDEE